MAGYTRQSVADIVDGEAIIAAPLNNEFNAIQAAMHATTGHAHDGSSGNGPKLVLTSAASVSGTLPLANGGTNAVLTDPNADRIMFWDDSAGAVTWLTASTGLAITTTNITMSFLGLESLVDPNADRILFWDDSAGSFAWLSLPTGLTFSGTGIALANDLSGLEGLSSTGFATRTTTDTWAQRTFQAPAAGFTITNPAGIAGDPTFVLANDLAGIEGVSGTGLLSRTATDTWSLTTAPTSVATHTALRAVNAVIHPTAILTDTNLAGIFFWDSSDLSSTLLGSDITSSAVNSGTDTITSVAHGLRTGWAVVTTTAVNGLSLNTLYYIIRVDADNFRLASSFMNAHAGTAFDLTNTTTVTVKRHYDWKQGIYVTPTAAISGASGAWVRRSVTGPDVNVKWFGALGTGSSDDDTEAFQAAIVYAEFRRSTTIRVPQHSAGNYYKISKPLRIVSPIAMSGEHMNVTIAQPGTMATSDYMFLVDGTVNPNLEKVFFENLTIRPYLASGTRARGMLVDTTADFALRNVVFYTPYIGVTLTGTRGYSTQFENVQFYSATVEGLLVSAFTGGGIHHFDHVRFTSCAVGLRIDATSTISSINFNSCGWETNVQAFECLGNLRGATFNGCYTEGNTVAGGGSFRFIPAAGTTQRAVKFSGGYYHTDAEAWVAIIGGDGTATGFTFQNLELDGHSSAVVRKNGTGTSSDITVTGCYVDAITSVVNNGPYPVQNLSMNRNSTGIVAENGALTLANGANSNVALPYGKLLYITGPTGAFNLTGLVASFDGDERILWNSTSQNMTMTHDATSTAANRFICPTGADMATTGVGAIRIIYSTAASRWLVTAFEV